jgi:ribokinase
MTRVAVVGHVEWLTFARVDAVPPVGGIAHATETWAGAGGGGGVAAVQLAKLAGTCHLFTAFGDDDVGHRAAAQLEASGVRILAARRPDPSREAVCFVDRDGERTITTLGPRLEARGADPLPWELFEDVDAAYVTAGDAEAIRRARAAAVLVVSTRHLGPLIASGVRANAVVGSARDPLERYDPSALAHAPPELVVLTEGSHGGTFQTADGRGGSFEAVAVDEPIVDTYGAGDSFHAGLTFGLGTGLEPAGAIALAARCGAAALRGRGPTGGQLTARDLGEYGGRRSQGP